VLSYYLEGLSELLFDVVFAHFLEDDEINICIRERVPLRETPSS
jgi:hypothetical protein